MIREKQKGNAVPLQGEDETAGQYYVMGIHEAVKAVLSG